LSNEISESGVSRRTVVKVAAWSVPAVAVAVAAPSAAASVVPGPPVDGFVGTFGQNGQVRRGIDTRLVDEDFNAVPFPAGTTFTVTITDVDNGSVTLGTITGATLLGTETGPDGETIYTFSAFEGGTNARVGLDVYGDVAVHVVYHGDFGTFATAPQSITGGAPV
jgi:hypothetical protein